MPAFWSAGRLVSRCVGLLVGFSVGLLVCGLVDLLVYVFGFHFFCSAGLLARRFVFMTVFV